MKQLHSLPAISLLGLLLLALLDQTTVRVSALLAKGSSSFALSRPSHLLAKTPSWSEGEDLIQKTKDYLASPSPDYWADDFVFRGPVIGPLVKKDLIATLGAVRPSGAFEDFESNSFGFTLDPLEEGRVWYFVRPRGVFAKPYQHPTQGTIQPNHKALIGPPEARSVVWNKEGKIRYQTVGYVMDRFTGDTTGGMGAVFGLFHHMGVAIDGTPGNPSLCLLQRLGEFLPEGTVPKSYSKEEDIPAWWTDKRRGADK